MHVHTIYPTPSSYTEKKAMKQFQIKLKKSCERVGREDTEKPSFTAISAPVPVPAAQASSSTASTSSQLSDTERRTRLSKIMVEHSIKLRHASVEMTLVNHHEKVMYISWRLFVYIVDDVGSRRTGQ